MKKWQVFLICFFYLIMLGIAFDITDYLIEKNLLDTWHVFLIELMFLVLGWFGAHLEIKLSKNKTKKK